MLINHDRKKLLSAIAYFSLNTKSCGKTKLFKLLYFLDFEHFKETGRSVTGLEYYAWKLGPVPTALCDELESPEQDFLDAIKFEEDGYYNNRMTYSIKALIEPDMSHFTKRELALIEKLALEYKNSNAADMVEKTHLQNLPWYRVYIQENKPQKLIPYIYAIDTTADEHIMELAKESKEIKDRYR